MPDETDSIKQQKYFAEMLLLAVTIVGNLNPFRKMKKPALNQAKLSHFAVWNFHNETSPLRKS